MVLFYMTFESNHPAKRTSPHFRLSCALHGIDVPFPTISFFFRRQTMLSTITSQAIHFRSNKMGGTKPKDASKLHRHQGVLQVNLGPSFHVLLDVDSDVETPSPLTLHFDLPKPTSSPLKAQWADSDSDSDSDTESECDVSDDSQYISIPSDSPFYCPPTPPAFHTAFDLPTIGCIPFACQALEGAEDYSKSAAELFHAELEHLIPEEMKKDLFLVDGECLRSMDEELYLAPLDAFMDVCLARQRPATLSLPPIDSRLQSPDVPQDSNEQEFIDPAALSPKYYLASFLDLQQLSGTSLHPSLRPLLQARGPVAC
ncbi:hypothetical protein DFH07DRAFT_550499 [Mycena maculata]|uniref:Uncharacterized protein n=1 Tax=Mycena maculata TaxID=230809 RepID=A0AAD7N8G4_9AGAR|nr:hypothetical protein DFH07DRAFT_550499 [Mycena maculata]